MTVRLGIVTEPDLPAQVGNHLRDVLPEAIGDDRDWEVEVLTDSLAAGRASGEEVLVLGAEMRERHGWDAAVVVTDLPVRQGWRAVLAHSDVPSGTGLVSLPAVGAVRIFARAERLVLQVIGDLTAAPTEGSSHPEAGSRVRYATNRRRGMARLVSGMVRANRPWRLVSGLLGALAAALATSVFGLSSSTIWQISTQTGPWRIGIAAVASVVALAAWLIVRHDLWETRSRGADDRDQALLYNTSTVVTLGTGVACLFLTLLVINLVVAVLLVPGDLMSSTMGVAVGWSDYVELAVGFSSMGMVAGALGSSFESDEAVRRAAYGYRERRRRERMGD